MNLLAVRQDGKFFQAHVYSNGIGGLRERLRLAFDREACEPFSGRRASNGERLDSTLDKSMQLDLDASNLRQLEFPMLKSKSRLRIGEAVVARARIEARVAYGLSLIFWQFLVFSDTAKECVKGFFQPLQYVHERLPPRLAL